MTQGNRTTALNIVKYRRLVTETISTATKAVFDGYGRDWEFDNLKIGLAYPLAEQDYPCIVLDFGGGTIQRAGVGHYEQFDDATGILRKWLHNRFEGTLTFHIFTLSPLDRDILVDAVQEMLTFGTLYSNDVLSNFWKTIYGDPTSTTVELEFTQLMLNLDEVSDGGNNVSPVTWNAEDKLIYSSSLSIEIHGGFYNIVPDITWSLVSGVDVHPYPQGEIDVVLPLGNAPGSITNPRQFFDDNYMPDPQYPDQDPVVANTLIGKAVISGVEVYSSELVPVSGEGANQ